MVEKKRSKKQAKVHKKKLCLGFVVIILVVVLCTLATLFGAFSDLNTIGVVFSEESGLYEKDIDLEMEVSGFSTKSPLMIRYNMNGDDLNNESEEYNSSIKLEVPEEGYKLYTITASVCDTEQNCTKPVVAFYLLGRNLSEDMTLDIIGINCSWHNLYDYDYGIMTGGATYDLNRKSVDGDTYVSGNYNNRGKKWLRDAFIYMVSNDGETIINREGYIGISGETSSSYSVKSLKVAFYDEGKRDEVLKLRSGSQDQFSGNIRSSLINRLIAESGYDGGTSTERVVVFLNGEFYGIFDLQDDYSRVNLANRFGISNEKAIRIFKGSERMALEENGFWASIWDDLDTLEKRVSLERKVDMESFLIYYAIQILVNNTDWPMNNYMAWKYKGDIVGTNKYTDGRLRFLLRDTDLTYFTDNNIDWFDGCKGDIFKQIMEGEYRGTESVFPKVMESEYYRNRFIEILRELINGPFRTENVLKIIDEEAAKIDHQVELWSTPEEYEEWEHWIEVLRGAAASREQEVRDDVFKYFGVVL